MGGAVHCEGSSASEQSELDCMRCGRHCGSSHSSLAIGGCIQQPFCDGEDSEFVGRLNTTEFGDSLDSLNGVDSSQLTGLDGVRDASSQQSKCAVSRPVPMTQSSPEDPGQEGKPADLNYF